MNDSSNWWFGLVWFGLVWFGFVLVIARGVLVSVARDGLFAGTVVVVRYEWRARSRVRVYE
jgi:hypothetical protein